MVENEALQKVADALVADDLPRARQQLESLAESHPENAELWGLCGYLAMQEDDHGPAIFALKKAVALSPDDGRWRTELARGLIDRGEPGEAMLHLRRAVALDPRDVEALANLGEAWFVQEQWKTAFSWYREAAVLQPNSSVLWSRLGTACSRLGQEELAIQCWERSLQLVPTERTSGLALARTYLERAEIGRVEPILKELLAERPADPQAWWLLGQARIGAGDIDGARSCLEKAHFLDPSDDRIVTALEQLGG